MVFFCETIFSNFRNFVGPSNSPKDNPRTVRNDFSFWSFSLQYSLHLLHLNNILHNRTSLVIAHRISTINKLDRLIVMDEGKIIEIGTHKQLLALSGHYAKLWSLQSGGFLPTVPKNKEIKKII